MDAPVTGMTPTPKHATLGKGLTGADCVPTRPHERLLLAAELPIAEALCGLLA